MVLDYAKYRDEFKEWLTKRIKSSTWQNYIGVLDRTVKYTKIYSKEQLKEIYESLEKNKANFAKGFRNFLNFLQDKGIISKAIAEEFKTILDIPKAGTDKKVPSDNDIIEANEYFKQNLDEVEYLVFQLLLYSGLRLDDIVQMLNSFDPKKLEFLDGIARYDMEDIGDENKEAFECYMPAWLGKKLLELYNKLNGFSVDYNKIKDVINYKASSGKTISAKYIRKWVNNFLKRNKVPKDERNFILGRKGELNQSVEFTNYLELREDADREYARIVYKFPIKEG